MSIVDLIDIPRLSAIQISPDGTQILYQRTDADWDQNKTVTHIWRVDADGTGLIQLTNGENGESGAVWSPEGNRIAFVAKRDDDDHDQIWLINNEGGEGIRLTEHPTGVSSLRWSGAGGYIYFLAEDEKSEEEKAREEIDDNVYRFEEDKRSTHLWRVDVETGESEQVIQGDYTVRGYTMSRDGTLIAYRRAPSPLLDDTPNAEVWLMASDDTTGGRQLTDNHVYEGGLQFSPDNTQILFSANTNDDLTGFYYNDRLFLMSTADGDPTCIVCGGEYEVGGARWAADGSEIFFLATTGVRRNLYRYETENGDITPFTVGDHAVFSWDYEPAADLHAMTFSSPESPGEIMVSTSRDPELTQVTHLYDYIAEDFTLPEVELVSYKGEDGVDVEGLVYLPIGY
ncbi:MAG: DPP IV N-terminal domain-containing protein, partial [Candidatus Latescibacterota bacterium]